MRLSKPLILALAALPILAIGGIRSAAAYTVPANLGGGYTGVPSVGYPDFYTDARVTFSKLSSGAYKLTASDSGRTFTFNTDPSHSWNVKDGDFQLTANFNRYLAFQNGTVDIEGYIPGYDGRGSLDYGYSGPYDVTNKAGNLYHADLVKFGIDLSPLGIGFMTDAATDTGWATQFMTSNESVWLYSTNIWNTILRNVALRLGEDTWSINITGMNAVTTVPIPAAAWLFASGLMGLFAARRRAVPATA